MKFVITTDKFGREIHRRPFRGGLIKYWPGLAILVMIVIGLIGTHR